MNKTQNIFDNESFFQGYKELRNKLEWTPKQNERDQLGIIKVIRDENKLKALEESIPEKEYKKFSSADVDPTVRLIDPSAEKRTMNQNHEKVISMNFDVDKSSSERKF